MTINEELVSTLHKTLSGDAWYGSSVYQIIEQVSFDSAYKRPPNSVHSIAEILLHMLGWTEEVVLRMQGKSAELPPGGDWPNVGMPDEQVWHSRVDEFKLMNAKLVSCINKFDRSLWNRMISDDRNKALGTGVTYKELVNGLIQHHVYHAGQIALLNRMLK